MSIHWNNIVTSTAAAIQAGALVVAGGFGYARFVRRRVHHASLTPSVEAALETLAGRKCLRVTTTIHNSGTFRMVFAADCDQKITVTCLDQTEWLTSTSPHMRWSAGSSVVAWDQLVDLNGFKDTTVDLEPGDTATDSWLVPLPQGTWVAYNVTLDVSAIARGIMLSKGDWSWTARTVVMES